LRNVHGVLEGISELSAHQIDKTDTNQMHYLFTNQMHILN